MKKCPWLITPCTRKLQQENLSQHVTVKRSASLTSCVPASTGPTALRLQLLLGLAGGRANHHRNSVWSLSFTKTAPSQEVPPLRRQGKYVIVY